MYEDDSDDDDDDIDVTSHHIPVGVNEKHYENLGFSHRRL
jgi:hypothetical protein